MVFGTARRTRAVVAALIGTAVLCTSASNRAHAQSGSLKQRLLAEESRDADASERLTERAHRRVPRGALAYMPGHIVVKFAPEMDERAVAAMAAGVGASRVSRPHHADFTYVSIPPDADPAEAAAKLAAMPGVIYAEPDARVFPTYKPNDPLYRYQWNLQKLDMERAWDINPGAADSVIVAVVDSGVAYLTKGAFAQAPELAGTKFAPGYDFVWDDNEPVDFDGHGTHVSGTIAQTTNNSVGVAGMAFNVTLMPIKAIYGDWDAALDAPFPYGASTVARGIRFAADNGAKVVNLSLGSTFANTATRDAMQYAIDKGVFIVVAAGNEAEDGNTPLYPAVYAKDMDGAIAVAAVDHRLQRAYYSNANDYVEIAAPGGDITADENNDDYGDGVLQQTFDFEAAEAGVFNRFEFVFLQGTSMATPHVSAFAALLYDQGVTNPKAVEAALKKFATDLGPKGRDDETGYGLVNPRATLRGLGLRR